MVELTANSPLDLWLPISLGHCDISEIIPQGITSISPFKANKNNNYTELNAVLPHKYPNANRATGKDGNRLIWMSHDTAFLIGPAPEKITAKHAATVDQSDGWVIVRVAGDDCEKVLARLTPIDVRAHHFKRGYTARSMINHLNVSITRVGANAFDLMVMRSFARTLVEDLTEAMKTVAAR